MLCSNIYKIVTLQWDANPIYKILILQWDANSLFYPSLITAIYTTN